MMCKILAGIGILSIYMGVVLFLARMASYKWHPDRGKGRDE